MSLYSIRLPPRCRMSPVGCEQSKVGECASLTSNSLSSWRTGEVRRGIWLLHRSLKADPPLVRGSRSECGPVGSMCGLAEEGPDMGDRDHLPPPMPARHVVSERLFLCQGHQWYFFLPMSCCHLIGVDPVLPPIRIPLRLGLFTALMHKALCTYTSSPVRNSQKGISSWTAAPDPGLCSPVLGWSRVTPGTCVRGSHLWRYRLEVPGVVGEEQEVDPSEAPPLW